MSAAVPSSRVSIAGGRLTSLRSRIAGVRRRRQAIRTTATLAAATAAALVAVAAVFLIDWTFSPSVPVRLALLAAATAAVAGFWWIRARPLLGRRESDLDVALSVERRQGIDSDLVAALEFDSPAADPSGSADLRQAVVAYVAEFCSGWSVGEGVPEARLGRRLAVLAVLASLAGAAIAVRPDVAGVFLRRMLLATDHYPTRTRIVSLEIAGQAAPPLSARPPRLAVPEGVPVGFRVELDGVMPDSGRVRIVPASGRATEIELRPDADAGRHLLAGELAKLTEQVRVQVMAGDAWTDPVFVDVVPLPKVDLTLTARPPSHAAVMPRLAESTSGARQISVLEGSRVDLEVRCDNKPLRQATLVIQGEEHPLAPADGDGSRWTLPAAATLWAAVKRPVRFEVNVLDEDGLSCQPPLSGAIRVRPDARPVVSAEALTRLVLPAAQPTIAYRANDDFGLTALEVVLERLPATEPASARQPVVIPVPLAAGPGSPLRGVQLPLTGDLRVSLQPLGLAKGDQVRVTLRATDDRGNAGGETSTSEPILLTVTDESGILAALAESDERSARQLDAIIERQLDVGGER